MLLTLGRCQTGDADGAMEAIEHVDVEDFPFGRGRPSPCTCDGR